MFKLNSLHLIYGRRGNAALRMIGKATDLYGEDLASMDVLGHRLECDSGHCANHVKRNHGLHQGRLVGSVDKPGASLHSVVAGRTVSMGPGVFKYVLVVVDEWSRFSWVYSRWTKNHNYHCSWRCYCSTSTLRPVNLVRRGYNAFTPIKEDNSRRIHLRSSVIIHTSTDRAQHESNSVVELNTGMLKVL